MVQDERHRDAMALIPALFTVASVIEEIALMCPTMPKVHDYDLSLSVWAPLRHRYW